MSARLFPRQAYERLRTGTIVPYADLAGRVFADAQHGFALARIKYGTYPAATLDGGRTWRIDGPFFPTLVAGAVAVMQAGASGRDTYFASESLGDSTVVAVTTDAGRRWWQALMPGGLVLVGAFAGELTAIVAEHTRNARGEAVAFSAYHSKNGRRWIYDAHRLPPS